MVVPFSGKAENYRQVPESWARTPGAVYTYITTNNDLRHPASWAARE
ncbi:MAG: hypothetical protein IPI35_21025 [Deltaproteobacteria bacterium]|nr:hypothetical protein [Deltaproteobacteria bacterium]